jgi:hypothetical protein
MCQVDSSFSHCGPPVTKVHLDENHPAALTVETNYFHLSTLPDGMIDEGKMGQDTQSVETCSKSIKHGTIHFPFNETYQFDRSKLVVGTPPRQAPTSMLPEPVKLTNDFQNQTNT